ncbi:tripartite tricarboxylate transporter TctB family protein [Ornithinimicrobium sp. W1679]|uniref:tripartite tricarboxylate transporter TctB family protein n=1 Tax=Ornithinimicrobium sp. W1679 TaxID=3418770 RepID=UPI003CE917D8
MKGTAEGDRRPPPNRTDLVTGVASLVVGAVVIPYGAGMPDIREGIPGPGLFPMMIGGFLVLLGVALVLTTLLGRRTASVPEAASPGQPVAVGPPTTGPDVVSTDAGAEGPRRWVNGVVVLGAVLFYVAMAETLGFLLTMTVVVSAILLVLRTRWWVSVLTGVITSLALWGMFEQALLVQLPDGLLEGF